MSTFEHFRANAWKARDMGYRPDRRITPKIIDEDRAGSIRESMLWRSRERSNDWDTSLCRHARYEALLTAFNLRGSRRGHI